LLFPSTRAKSKPKWRPSKAGGQLLLISFFIYYATIKMEAICVSETTSSHKTKRHGNPEDSIVHDASGIFSVLIEFRIILPNYYLPDIGWKIHFPFSAMGLYLQLK
jgi:hypothetical protein